MRVLLEHDPGSATFAHLHASRGNRHWSAVALLLEQELDLSHEDWLEVLLSCVAGGQTALLAGATYLQWRDAFMAHQLHWRRWPWYYYYFTSMQ